MLRWQAALGAAAADLTAGNISPGRMGPSRASQAVAGRTAAALDPRTRSLVFIGGGGSAPKANQTGKPQNSEWQRPPSVCPGSTPKFPKFPKFPRNTAKHRETREMAS